MSWESKVIWSEGMFLQPQHFQQHDRYLERLIEARARPTLPYGWGFTRLELDETALALGKVALASASGLFPDGTPFDFPFTHPAPAPLDIPADARDQPVVLAVPLCRRGGRESDYHAARHNGANHGTNHNTTADGLARFSVGIVEVDDSTAQGAVPIEVGQLQLRLLLGKDATDAYACLGAVRVTERRADNALQLDRQYIAPALALQASGTLSSYCDEVHGLLHQRGNELGTQLGQPGRGGVAEIADFLLLQTVNRYQPLFAHLRQVPALHPERLFAAMLGLAGDLATFSRADRRPPAYPEYRHDDLRYSFTPLMADLRASLSMVLQRSAIAIELQDRKYGVRLAVLPDRGLLKSASFVLAVNAQMPSETLRTRFPSHVKIGPVERIRDLVNLALPGIALRSMPVAPRQIPYHAGFNYFELERSGELWGQLEHSGGLAMHIAGDFPGLELEFWGIWEGKGRS
ncbi:type VI secretion system baseplate subunit TssK [Pseudoduganella albidiflava]|uniref:Type VI secretion system baseplate subunit TssK n=1 Tax=Pseudoduganella albidiflava TaxID=321983 RepID=A0A411WX09_9BURK|nr:type VI secretion system baseplate subunit TssK [Pseudoduganella albidiflava]QBI01300.1 type VI secretion system baseplate subunit TssK [Pseudoduganella albidiflava]GGY36754.1 type VI secretion system-associated protein [Pseudoduganella albidiflava]